MTRIDFCLFIYSTAKHDKSPCPVSVSKEPNVVVSILTYSDTLNNYNYLTTPFFSQIVRKLFPSLASEDVASGIGFLSPQKSCTTLHRGTLILLHIFVISNKFSLIVVLCNQQTLLPVKGKKHWRHPILLRFH